MQDNTVSHKSSAKKCIYVSPSDKSGNENHRSDGEKFRAYLELCHAIHRFCQPKVRNFKFRWPVLSKEHVLGLQVSVCDSFRMNVLIT